MIWDMLTSSNAWWTIAVGAFSAISCAILGCYLVLRRLSLIGDAISHAVLPGLVIAFVIAGSMTGNPRSPVAMMLGAVVMGLLTAFLTDLLSRLGRVPSDSAMGVVFTSFFALGVILINRYASQIDLDPGCVLYGNLILIPMDTIPFQAGPLGIVEVPRVLCNLAAVLALVLVFVAVLWKELKISSFDPALAVSMGISAGLMHYLLMAAVATTTVASFEAVGSILVIAMLIVPGATAHMLTDRMFPMMLIAAGVAAFSAFFGYWTAVWIDTEVAGMMAVVAGAQFTLAVAFAPRYGLLARLWHNLGVALRVHREDALARLWRLHEAGADPALARADLRSEMSNPLLAKWALAGLLSRKLLIAEGSLLRLTQEGRQVAGSIIRSHRLWETFQTLTMGRDPQAVDRSARRVEHFLTPETTDRIDQVLDQPSQDPHGSEIPRVPEGE